MPTRLWFFDICHVCLLLVFLFKVWQLVILPYCSSLPAVCFFIFLRSDCCLTFICSCMFAVGFHVVQVYLLLAFSYVFFLAAVCLTSVPVCLLLIFLFVHVCLLPVFSYLSCLPAAGLFICFLSACCSRLSRFLCLFFELSYISFLHFADCSCIPCLTAVGVFMRFLCSCCWCFHISPFCLPCFFVGILSAPCFILSLLTCCCLSRIYHVDPLFISQIGHDCLLPTFYILPIWQLVDVSYLSYLFALDLYISSMSACCSVLHISPVCFLSACCFCFLYISDVLYASWFFICVNFFCTWISILVHLHLPCIFIFVVLAPGSRRCGAGVSALDGYFFENTECLTESHRDFRNSVRFGSWLTPMRRRSKRLRVFFWKLLLS